MGEAKSLKELLSSFTMTGELYESQQDGSVVCFACGHRCVIRDGRAGICKVRFNTHGELRVPANYSAGLQCDPIEKKPFYHVKPGAAALTFGMLGCDYHCAYCQNWITSQALRDPNAVASIREVRPIDLILLAKRYGAKAVVSSYNEPLITSEWAAKIFREAKKEGLLTGYVSNGNATPEVLDYLRPVTDLYKIDLKAFREKSYRKLGGTLKNVLKSIEMVYERGFWMEVVTLVVPGFNDSEAELTSMAEFIAAISKDIPWHVTAFHQDYKMQDPENTPAETLLHAVEIGHRAGLHFVYAGNLPGSVANYENTQCPGCHTLLVKRLGYHVQINNIKDGKCPQCGRSIPGVW